MTETQQLLAKFVDQGSEIAFRELVERYVNLVYSTAMRMVNGDHQTAEDVSQMVFADLAKEARRLSKDTRLGGWLHRHTCFIAAKTLRGERRRRNREREALTMNTLNDDAPGTSPGISQELDEAINQLAEIDRAAIVLRFFEQHDFRVVGSCLGISEEAARKRVTRALEKLNNRLSRRKIVLPAAGMAALLSGSAISAPAGLASGIVAPALAAAAVKGSSIAATLFVVSLIALAGITITSVLQHESLAEFRRENQGLRSELGQLSALKSENNLLSNQLSRLRQPSTTTEEHHELLRLRGEVGLLRDQLNEFQKLRMENASVQPRESAQQKEVADIVYHFVSLPVNPLFAVYGQLRGKKVLPEPNMVPGKTVHIETQHRLTTNEAIRVIEQALYDQAKIELVDTADGNVLARSVPSNQNRVELPK